MNTDKILIFVVDDDALLLSLIIDNLSDYENYTVRGFSTAEDCIEQLYQKPKIIVLDYHLNNDENIGVMNGMQALKKIKEYLPGTKVIILSGQNRLNIAGDLLDMGVFDYIMKDIDAFKVLESKIVKALEIA